MHLYGVKCAVNVVNLTCNSIPNYTMLTISYKSEFNEFDNGTCERISVMFNDCLFIEVELSCRMH